MLFIHRAERADRLVAALGDVLAEPQPDPLAPEVVAVHSRGIERWIAQELSERLGAGALGGDGVCAGIEFPFPGRLVQEAVARGSDVDPETDPWVPERLTWALLELVEDPTRRHVLGPLEAVVGGGDRSPDGPGRRFGAVRHVADLFDRYGVHRPDMVCRWRDGEDVGPDGATIDWGARWQPALWRAVRAMLDVPAFAERWDVAVGALRDDPTTVAHLPERLTLFGLTALPATYLQVVEALAAHRDVHLMLLHPSADLWARVARTVGDPAPSALPAREDDPTAELPRNPLLRSWGRDVREVQLLAPTGSGTRLLQHPGDDRPPATLLERLQHDVRADRHPGSLTGSARPRLDPDDRSVQLHDCHGRLRQVEVLRQAILHLLADTPDLEPRDIIVMCPDIEAFAPLITAVFGTTSTDADGDRRGHDAPPSLRVRLADRALLRTNPLLEVVGTLLELVDGRMTASSVMDLLTRAPVRRRFGLSTEDTDRIEEWITDLRVRWGFDAAHRVRHGLPPLDAHTWQAGIRRLLLGATMADEQWRTVGDVVPYDDVEGSDTAVAGRFVELLQRVSDALTALSAPRPAQAWRDAVVRAADRLTLPGVHDEWQRLQLHRLLDDLVREATVGGRASAVELTLPELRAALSERLAGRPSRTSHRTGDLTISTLVPMRSVPHRVVCLLGLDDGTFPRQVVPDGDDLLHRAPRVGDRDPRSEDRQLLLDALLAAQEHLVVTYAGRDERTNEPRPPAVPVDELRDAIDRTVATGTARPSDAVTIRHPLAEHDPRNFEPGGLDGWPGPTTPWGFDAAVQQAASARRRPSVPTPPFLHAPLPAVDEDVIDLDDLIAFLEHPVKAFVRRRLDVRLPSEEDEVTDAIPAELGNLDKWEVGRHLLDGQLSGHDTDRILAVLRASGVIPPGELATGALAEVEETVAAIIELSRRYGVTAHRSPDLDITVDLPDGRTLTGVVPGVDNGLVTNIGYSRVKAKYRLATWARFLAANAQEPHGGWGAVTGGRPPRGRSKAQVVRLLPLEGGPGAVAATARDHLQRLVDLYARGLRSPLPLYCETSAEMAAQLRKDDDPTRWADKRWETDRFMGFPKEDRDPYHLLVLGEQVPAAQLFTELCRDAEERSWAGDDRRVVAYAWRLWEPIVAAERTCTA